MDKFLVVVVGLMVQEVENVLFCVLVENWVEFLNVLVDMFVKVIMDVKVEVVCKIDILEIMLFEKMFNVGGFVNLKVWVEKWWYCFLEDVCSFGIELLKGMLFVGFLGIGKSLVVKVVVNLMSFFLIKFDVLCVFVGVVGELESCVCNVLKMIEVMLFCVVLIDEIDKVLGGVYFGGGDSGVLKCVFGVILIWMQEIGSLVFNVLLVNWVDSLLSEFLCWGCVDEVFFVFVFDVDECMEVFKIYFSKWGKDFEIVEGLVEVVLNFDGYVLVEIECVVKDVLIDVFIEKKELIGKLIFQQFGNMVLIFEVFEEDFKVM